jgi:predicted Zn finger-like uncharacterized protein
MLIVCPSCATSYQVEPNSLGQGGRSVRCARCRNVWFATIPAAVPTLAGADAWDVIDTGPRVPAVDRSAESAAPSTAAPAEFAATDGIDVASLSAEIASERADQEAQADVVLAAVTREQPAVESPSLAGAEIMPPPEAKPAADAADAVESFAARQARRQAARRGVRWPRSGLSAALLLLVAVHAGVVAWREHIVQFLPQTAALYAAIGLPVNLRGLAFENIRMSRAEQEGIGVLVVEGSIVNVTGRPVEVPRLRLAVRNEAKQEIYAWTALPSRAILAPGDALPFRSRLASPPADAREVQVRFFSARDMVAGLN